MGWYYPWYSDEEGDTLGLASGPCVLSPKMNPPGGGCLPLISSTIEDTLLMGVKHGKVLINHPPNHSKIGFIVVLKYWFYHIALCLSIVSFGLLSGR